VPYLTIKAVYFLLLFSVTKIAIKVTIIETIFKIVSTTGIPPFRVQPLIPALCTFLIIHQVMTKVNNKYLFSENPKNIFLTKSSLSVIIELTYNKHNTKNFYEVINFEKYKNFN